MALRWATASLVQTEKYYRRNLSTDTSRSQIMARLDEQPCNA